MLIARLADGGMRDALSMLDLCAANSPQVTEKTVSEVTGLIGQDYLFEITDAINAGNFGSALTLVDQLGGQAVEFERLCQQLITHYRNLLVTATAKEPERLVVCLPDAMQKYKGQAGRHTSAQLIDSIRTLQDTQTAMARSSSRRAEMELGLVKLCDRRMSQSPEALMARIDELEAKLNRLLAEGVAPAAPQPEIPKPIESTDTPPQQVHFAAPVQQPVSPTTAPPTVIAPQPSGPPELMGEEQWQQILERLTVTNKMLSAALAGSRAYLRGMTVLVECQNPVFLEMMRSNDFTRSSLKRAISEVTGSRYGVGPYVPDKTAAPAEKESSPLESLLKDAADQGVEVVRKD